MKVVNNVRIGVINYYFGNKWDKINIFIEFIEVY